MTTEEKLQYFAAHPLQACIIKDAEPYTPSIIEGVDYLNKTVISERVNYDPNLICLTLRGLEHKTDKEAQEIKAIVQSGFVEAGGIKARSLGYACGWGKYMIKDLINAGVLMIIDETT